MSFFFNGRLWITPATMSAVDDSQMYNRGLTVGSVPVYVGRSDGGQPNTVLRFGSPEEAIATLKGGDLLTAVLKAFDPSSETGGPATVCAVRINPATQSTLALLGGNGSPCINLATTDYGLKTGGMKVKVESASQRGLKLTSQYGTSYYSADNVYRNALSVQYLGASLTATVSVSDSTVTLSAPSDTVVATIDLNAFPSIQELVDRINATSGFSAAVLDGNGSKPALLGLDFVTGQDVKSAPFTVTANLQAAVDWFNSPAEGYLNAARVANSGRAPAPVDWTYLAGGSDGMVTMTEWANAYTALQSADVQWVTPLSSDPAIHAMNDAHLAYMSAVARKERRGLCGTASGTTDLDAITAAKALNSDRTGLTHLGYYDYDANGKLVLFEPYFMAALLTAMFAAVSPGTALTNKSIKVRGLERKLRNPTDTDALITGGVLCVEDTPNGYKVVRSVSTWLNNTNYNRVEISVGVAVDYTARTLRNAVDGLRGSKNSPATMGLAYTRAETALNELAKAEPQGPGVLVGDKANPPWRNLTVSVEGDALPIQVEASPVIPANYIPITIYAVPYSGSISG